MRTPQKGHPPSQSRSVNRDQSKRRGNGGVCVQCAHQNGATELGNRSLHTLRMIKRTTGSLALQQGQPCLPPIGSSSSSSYICAAPADGNHWSRLSCAACSDGAWNHRKIRRLKLKNEPGSASCKYSLSETARTMKIGHAVEQAFRESGCTGDVTEQRG